MLLAHNGRSKTYEREKNCGCKRLYVGILVVHPLNPEIKKCLSFSPFFLSFTFLSCLLFYTLPLALFTKLSFRPLISNSLMPMPYCGLATQVSQEGRPLLMSSLASSTLQEDSLSLTYVCEHVIILTSMTRLLVNRFTGNGNEQQDSCRNASIICNSF